MTPNRPDLSSPEKAKDMKRALFLALLALAVGLGLGPAAQAYLLLTVDLTKPGRLFAVTGKSAILTSDDGGKIWRHLAS